MTTNTMLTADIIAKAANLTLNSNLVMAKKVYSGYEKEFSQNINGYTVGRSVDIRKPADFTVRNGATAVPQDTTEGTTSITVDTQKGVDFSFTSQELTLDIRELSERVLQPAMEQLAADIDLDLLNMYKDVPNYVGTPGQVVNSFSDFSKAPLRMDQGNVPQGGRCSVLSPTDQWGMIGSQTDLYNDTINKPAYRKGTTGMIAGVDSYSSNNVPTHTFGEFAGSVVINGSITTSTITYAAVKDTNVQTIGIDALTAAAGVIKQGDVFTIAGVYAVNTVTKASLGYLKQFTVTADATASTNAASLIISPAMIWTGAHQTVAVDSAVTDLDGQAVTFVGTDSGTASQNLVFHKNAFGFVSVPLVAPPGAVEVGRNTYKGISVRVIPGYNVTSDVSTWRLDVLYGKKTIDPRLAVRLAGTA